MTQANVDLIMSALADLKGDVGDVKDHLAALNGRTRAVEEKVAVHKMLWMILAAVVTALTPFILKSIWPS